MTGPRTAGKSWPLCIVPGLQIQFRRAEELFNQLSQAVACAVHWFRPAAPFITGSRKVARDVQQMIVSLDQGAVDLPIPALHIKTAQLRHHCQYMDVWLK